MKKLSLLTISALLLSVPSFVQAMNASHVGRIATHAATLHAPLTPDDQALLSSAAVTTATPGVNLLRNAKSADDIRAGLAQVRAAVAPRGRPVAGDAGHAEDGALTGPGRPGPHARPAPRGKSRPLGASASVDSGRASPAGEPVLTKEEFDREMEDLRAQQRAEELDLARDNADTHGKLADVAARYRARAQALRAAYVRSMPTNTGTSGMDNEVFPVETARHETPGRHIEALDERLARTGRPPVAPHQDSSQMASKLQLAPSACSQFPADAERTAHSQGAWAFLAAGVTQAEWSLCMHTDQAQKLSVCFHNKDAAMFGNLAQTLKAQRFEDPRDGAARFGAAFTQWEALGRPAC